MTWEVIQGDCAKVLEAISTASIDAVVTDPPYGLSFMGKAWDYDVPGADIWRECLRVLKPGGHLLSFFGSRTYHRGVVQIEDAGFEIRDSLIWMYGTGFPKSLNVGKAIDEAAGVERKVVGATRGGVQSSGKFGAGGSRLSEAEKQHPVTAPATEAAAQWEGWGTALKPAHEPIVLARKPLTGTVAANVLAHGTGALNIDGCRIAAEDKTPAPTGGYVGRSAVGPTGLGGSRDGSADNLGRWPANVLLDEEAAALLDEQSGEKMHAAGSATDGKHIRAAQQYDATSLHMGRHQPHRLGDSGGASRFFYTAKAPRDERDAGLELLPAATGGEATDREEGSAGLSSPRAGAGRTGGARNIHPTVKPVSLMRWLVRLVTPPGGLVLDPFAGSGSTGVAALHEGFRFLGIEREAAYVRIATERLTAWAAVHETHTTIEARAAGQLALFAKASP